MKNSQRGLYISRNFRCRQPSRQVLRCGGRLRPSGFSVVGTSSMRRPASAPRTTISLANSMPVVRRSSALMLAALKPRRPQWKSPAFDAEEQPAEKAQHRIAEIAVQRRHGAGLDAAREAIAHDQFGAVAQPRHEGVERGEIIAVVGVAHDDVAAAGRGDAAEQRRAVALCGDRHDARAERVGDLLRAVGAAIVGDQHLAGDAAPMRGSAAPLRCRSRASPPR